MKIIATIKWPYWSTLDSWLPNFNFNERSSSDRASLPLKVVFHWNLFHFIPSLQLFVAFVSQEIKLATWVDTFSYFSQLFTDPCWGKTYFLLAELLLFRIIFFFILCIFVIILSYIILFFFFNLFYLILLEFSWVYLFSFNPMLSCISLV